MMPAAITNTRTASRVLRQVAVTGVVVGVIAIFTGCSSNNTQAAKPSAVPVVVATVQQKNVPIQLQAIGSVEPYSNVAVKTQITGELTGVFFKEGQFVKKGQLLFTLDKRPLQADLRRAEGALARDKAQAANAVVQARRYSVLWNQGVVAKEQYDTMQSNAEALQAAVRADLGAVQNAKVQLQYCTIYSPIDGRTGNLVVHQGNEVKANDVPALVTINQILPIYVTFPVPEQYLADISRYSQQNKKLAVAAAPPNSTLPPATGVLSFIDNTVDSSTGTIKLKGLFTNTNRQLWPGQFVNVVLTLANQPDAIVVPSQAVQTGQQGQFVFVVKSDMTTESRPVVISRTAEGQSIVAKGLAPGEQVVTDGQMRLVPGAKVDVKARTNDQNGQLADSAPAALPVDQNKRPTQRPKTATGN
jgi:multidrug efflux system membrane fusion protein